MDRAEIAAAVTRMQERKPRPEGVYRVADGWKNSREASITYADREGAEIGYRFARDYDRCAFND